MQLARMHDIAGCRLIFENFQLLTETRAQILGSRFLHVLKNKNDDYNYIKFPKHNGYRGIHDVYEYVSFTGAAHRWNGLLIELQYRTKIQHAWATAVEIVGSITGNEAKFDRGNPENQRFFSLSSEILARHHENQHSCHSETSTNEIKLELNDLERRIGIIRLLEGIHVSVEQLKDARNLILRMSPKGALTVYGFAKTRIALEKYCELEELEGEDDIVFVRGDTNEGIRSAFRNYFSDARDFTHLMREAMR